MAVRLLDTNIVSYLLKRHALATRDRRPPALTAGFVYGVATWIVGSFLVLPALHAKQAAPRRRPTENAVDLLAHLIYGAATAVVADELSSQSDRGPSSDSSRRATPVG